MAIIIFLIILSLLVFVHETGHLIAAKSCGIRVDEFGLGLPPRAKKLFTWRGTEMTLNWLPFGGFVKIFGENPDEADISSEDNFTAKRRDKQILVLVSGVLGNLILAWLLFSIAFMWGMPSAEGEGLPVENAHATIGEILPNSPASKNDLQAGDEILAVSRGHVSSALAPEAISNFISSSPAPVHIEIKRGDLILDKTLSPQTGLVEGRSAVGFALERIGLVKLGLLQALKEGFKYTYTLTWLTAKALIGFIKTALVGHADLGALTGPVGLVGIVGSLSALGFVYLITFTALISINLAVINLLPIPALDGGRILFVLIESISRRRIPAKVFNALNRAGFALLICLMVFITLRDVSHLFK